VAAAAVTKAAIATEVETKEIATAVATRVATATEVGTKGVMEEAMIRATISVLWAQVPASSMPSGMVGLSDHDW